MSRPKISEYLGSSRGAGLISAISLLYVLIMAVICLAMLLAKVLDGESTIGSAETDAFFIFHFTLSSVSIGVLLVLGVLKKLTTDNYYKQQRSLVFILGGATFLGTGGIIYESLRISLYVTDPDCAEARDGVHSVSCVIFVVLQITFILNYTKVRINRSVLISCAGRLVLMQVISTNICTWIRTIVWETEAELDTHEDVSGNVSLNHEQGIHAVDPNDPCASRDELSHLIAPYTFPLLIEFCVMASTILIAIWEKCGEEHHHDSMSHPRHKSESSTSAADYYNNTEATLSSSHAIVLPASLSEHLRNRLDGTIDKRLSFGDCSDVAPHHHVQHPHKAFPATGIDNLAYNSDSESLGSTVNTSDPTSTSSYETRPIILFTQKNRKLYYNNHAGFILGWILLSTVMVVIILYSYMIYGDVGYTEGLEIAIYTTDIVLCLVCILAIPYTAYRMSKLSYKDDELNRARKLRDGIEIGTSHSFKVDKVLLYLTFIALLAFQVLSMISAVDQNDWLIFIACLFQLLFGILQTIFINWFACSKRATKAEHFYKKPGRQGLEVLRTTNLALWLVNTFLLENTETKRIHWYSFGKEGWTILSNIFQPLTILYHFHAVVYYAEIIAHSYSSKYIGLERRSKHQRNETGQSS